MTLSCGDSNASTSNKKTTGRGGRNNNVATRDVAAATKVAVVDNVPGNRFLNASIFVTLSSIFASSGGGRVLSYTVVDAIRSSVSGTAKFVSVHRKFISGASMFFLVYLSLLVQNQLGLIEFSGVQGGQSLLSFAGPKEYLFQSAAALTSRLSDAFESAISAPADVVRSMEELVMARNGMAAVPSAAAPRHQQSGFCHSSSSSSGSCSAAATTTAAAAAPVSKSSSSSTCSCANNGDQTNHHSNLNVNHGISGSEYNTNNNNNNEREDDNGDDEDLEEWDGSWEDYWAGEGCDEIDEDGTCYIYDKDDDDNDYYDGEALDEEEEDENDYRSDFYRRSLGDVMNGSMVMIK